MSGHLPYPAVTSIATSLPDSSAQIPRCRGDLGWRNESIMELAMAGHGETAVQQVWAADIEAPEAIPLTTPTDRPATWRVIVEEWERFEGRPRVRSGQLRARTMGAAARLC